MSRQKHRPTAESPLPPLQQGMSKADALCVALEEFANLLGPGSLIPSERVIAEHYAMSRTTVRQSIDRLLADGVLFRRHGHGTFVAVPRPGHIDMLTSFSQDMRARGMTPGGKVLSASTEQATPTLAARLQVAPGSPVLRLARLRTADDRPMALERINLSIERFPGLTEVDWTDRSLYEELERKWGARIGSTENRIAAVLPDPADAALLEIDSCQPCLCMEGVTYDTNGVVLETGRSWYRGDLYDAIVRVQQT